MREYLIKLRDDIMGSEYTNIEALKVCAKVLVDFTIALKDMGDQEALNVLADIIDKELE